jgi:hypothetical protein
MTRLWWDQKVSWTSQPDAQITRLHHLRGITRNRRIRGPRNMQTMKS